jgi:lysine decarboxylase
MHRLDQNKTPLFTGLKKHWEKLPISGHVPGHKYGRVFPDMASDYFEGILKLDATEITGLDDLHDPEGMIEEAQALAADLYGAEATFFLVNGSTAGNLAMILASCPRGSRVLIQRNCHKSILNGLELAGAEPVLLSCEMDNSLGVAASVSVKQLEKTLKSTDRLSAVILTNPNYYGLSMDLERIIQKVHEYDIPILIDEAHGAHFVAGVGFPASALELGADMVVHSAHKTLPAMTMGSFLHVQGDLIKKEQVAYYLRMLQSSSPSYPIMASLDLARYYLASLKQKGTGELLKDNNFIREEIAKLEGIEIVAPECSTMKADPLKLTLRSTRGLSGYDLQGLLEKEGVFVELADPQNVLIILPLAVYGSKHDMIEGIAQALKDVTEHDGIETCSSLPSFPGEVSQLAVPLGQQQDYSTVKRELEDAVGEVAAESIIPYPPGIPVLLKGEKISQQAVDYILRIRALGARFQGNEGLKSNYIFIYKKKKE